MHNNYYIVPRTTLIEGYLQERKGPYELDCFEQMYYKGIRPNELTYACILKASMTIVAIDKEKEIHDELSR